MIVTLIVELKLVDQEASSIGKISTDDGQNLVADFIRLNEVTRRKGCN